MKRNDILMFVKNNQYFILAVALSVIFFICASSYNFFIQKPSFLWPEGEEFIKWSSPDETANYVFSKLYGQEEKLYIFEEYNLLAKNIIIPRSVRSDFGYIKPVSFLGLPILYGKIASIFSYEIIPYLTPLIGAIGIIFYFLFIRMIFSEKTALISAALLIFFPVYLYYSARSMFHNIPFVSFFIISLYYGVQTIYGKKPGDKNIKPANDIRWREYFKNEFQKTSWMPLFYSAMCGIFLGMAISIRTSEVLWIFPVLLILWLANLKKIGIIKPLLIICFTVFSFMPVLYWNQILFGAPLNGGYPEMNNSISEITQTGTVMASSGLSGNYAVITAGIKKINSVIFHFGLNFKQSFDLFRSYSIIMFYWIFWPASAGFIFFILKFKKLRKRHWVYLACLFVISLILIIYYGSWEFYDNPNKSERTIGNSYTRYWLPIYLGILPFASIFILRISQLLKKHNSYRTIFIVCLILFGYIVSINFLLFGSSEGLVLSAEKNYATRQEYGVVMGITENNSVIITRYHDKLFFPERKVIVGDFEDPNMLREYSGLAEILPVYYYNFNLPKKSIDYLNNRKFKQYGLKLIKIQQINNDFTLYKLEK